MGKDNQKTITQLVKEPCDKTHFYATINLDAMDAAAIDLKAGAFKVWIYLAKNNKSYKNFDLSSKDARENFGIKQDQWNTAIKELITKGYLIPVESQNPVANWWEFHEKPKIPLQEKP